MIVMRPAPVTPHHPDARSSALWKMGHAITALGSLLIHQQAVSPERSDMASSIRARCQSAHFLASGRGDNPPQPVGWDHHHRRIGSPAPTKWRDALRV